MNALQTECRRVYNAAQHVAREASEKLYNSLPTQEQVEKKFDEITGVALEVLRCLNHLVTDQGTTPPSTKNEQDEWVVIEADSNG